MTLNRRPFAIIAFLMFEENATGFVARRGLSISVYYSIAVYELTSGIVSAQILKLSFLRLVREIDTSLAQKIFK